MKQFVKRNLEAKNSLKESLEKAKKDYKILQDLSSQIADDEVAWQLAILQQVAGKIVEYLEQNPERIPVAEEFIEIYQDKAVVLMQQYFALEKIHFPCSEMNEIKTRINKTLSSLLAAYKTEFKRILDYQLMNLNTELDVFQSFIKEQPQEEEENIFPEELKESFFHKREEEKKKSSSKEEQEIKPDEQRERKYERLRSYEDVFFGFSLCSIFLLCLGLWQGHITLLCGVFDAILIIITFFLSLCIRMFWMKKDTFCLRAFATVYSTILLFNLWFALPEGVISEIVFAITAFLIYISCLMPDAR